jgi:carboxyl-terminal processing protease
VEDHTVADLTGRLRGPEGTRVLLRVARKGHREPLEVAITRQRFTSPTVSSRMLDPAFGYLRIEHIAKNSGVLARRLVGGLLDGSDTRGLVLDLRGNSGGSILAASAIADLFLREGVLIETKGRGGLPVPELRNRVDATDGAGQEHTSTPLVILVDRKTASSAELLAAVLARHDRALILGQRTFGKAVVQKTYDFGAGGTLTLKVTVARSYAAGAPIPEDGLAPDISLEEESSADLQLHCEAGRSPDAGPFAVLGTGSASADDAALDLAVRVLGDYGRAGRREMLDRMCAEPRWLAREAPTRPHG